MSWEMADLMRTSAYVLRHVVRNSISVAMCYKAINTRQSMLILC